MKMNIGFPNMEQQEETQFTVIRDLMTDASLRGDWLTLAEIAECTEFGEASISAQLRHLRKPRFGGFRVEKRRREVLASGALNRSTNHSAHDSPPNNFALNVVAEIWPDLFGDLCPGATPAAPRDVAAASPSFDLNLRAGGAHVSAPWEYRVFEQSRSRGDEFFEGSPRLAKAGNECGAGRTFGESVASAGENATDHARDGADDVANGGGFPCG
jgi:hypothetical protein